MDPKSLPNGFITVDEAVALINSDTRDDAKVDTQYLVSHIDWIEEAHNFRIPLVRLTTKEELEPTRRNFSSRLSATTIRLWLVVNTRNQQFVVSPLSPMRKLVAAR